MTEKDMRTHNFGRNTNRRDKILKLSSPPVSFSSAPFEF